MSKITNETISLHIPLHQWEETSPIADAVKKSGMDNPTHKLAGISPHGNLIVNLTGKVNEEDMKEYKFTGELKIQVASTRENGLYQSLFTSFAEDNTALITKFDYSVFGLPYGHREENVSYLFEPTTTIKALKEWLEDFLEKFDKKVSWSLNGTRDDIPFSWTAE